MNNGEINELIIQLVLIHCRDNEKEVPEIGKIYSIKSFKEFEKLPLDLKLETIKSLNHDEIKAIAAGVNLDKAATGYKADTWINNIPYSLKYTKMAPPALVNHTTRPGFEMAAEHSGGDINKLDAIIEEYWNLRINGRIGEDIANSNPLSPFSKHKEALRPFLNYFLFMGTGKGLSRGQAEQILSFTDPLNFKTWKIFDKSNAIDLFWDRLVFSIRARKGMPDGYPDNLSPKQLPKKASIDKWVRFIDAGYRGSLHIRVKQK